MRGGRGRRLRFLLSGAASCVLLILLAYRFYGKQLLDMGEARRRGQLPVRVMRDGGSNATVQASELVAFAWASVPRSFLASKASASASGSPTASASGSRSGSGAIATSLELAAILAAAQQPLPETQKQQGSEKNGARNGKLLCAVFSKADQTSTRNILSNMENLGPLCDWALIFYGGDSSLLRLLEHAVYEKKVEIRIVRSQMVDSYQEVLRRFGLGSSSSLVTSGLERKSKYQFNAAIYPKSLQYMLLLDLLPAYERVWMLDSDLSFSGFDAKGFLRTTECAFTSVPLIAQPLIAGATQSYKFLNADEWARKRMEDDKGPTVIASSSDFVEIQAPLMDARFCEWFLRFFVTPILVPSHILGADWGLDELFCNAARIFAQGRGRGGGRDEGLGTGKWAEQEDEVCMLVTSGTPLMHLDAATLDETLGRDLKKYLNKAHMAIIKALFPHVYNSGHESNKHLSPLTAPGLFKQVVANQNLNPNCV